MLRISSKIKSAFVPNMLKYIYDEYFEVKSIAGIKISHDSKFYTEIYDEMFSYLTTYLNKINYQIIRFYLKQVLKPEKVSFFILTKKKFNNHAILDFDNLSVDEFKVIVLLIVTKEESDIILKYEELAEKISSGNTDESINNEYLALRNKVREILSKYVQYNISDILYSIYHEFIRFKLIQNFGKVKYDKKLHILTAIILTKLILKIFGKKYAAVLTEKQTQLTFFILLYITHVYYFKFDPKTVIDTIIEDFSKDEKRGKYIKDFETLANEIQLHKYTSMLQLGDIFNKSSILPGMTNSQFTNILLQSIGSHNLIDMLTSYPSIVSLFIVSKYPTDYTPKVLVSFIDDLESLEDYVHRNYM